ncbi:M14 family zinc carboxypeptidase [Frigoriflavimonas asaccharolytica]|uniref:Peptidase M14 domain-containing protein n=1 Tax=Frigoriflavimonas asaccharolytica TaxID=2735899 RepID=A0A8J8G7N9_9FLAO|nr:M14 family zinc carboxypeptidase [Frigoriflavimonas asaccharolytica]NRS91467.1 hypothetical protein [Frigoriflavimonas asaccharolytica]
MKIVEHYLQNPNFPNRYISPEILFSYLQKNYSDYISEIGTSYLGKPIYLFSMGTGICNILAWSQMHGNESNATHAMLDLLEIKKNNEALFTDIFENISLDFVFMLNPDGSESWNRRNALDIDLNRDYKMESSKEFPILKNLIKKKKYDYALNLHEQRTIFSTDRQNPATLSFLAPAENVEKEITDTRKKAMSVISYVNDQMQNLIPNHVGRYNDEFYPNSTGDNFTKSGIPTLLFEGGHFPNDYLRIQTRKYYTIALYIALEQISKETGSTKNWEQYFEIPENIESHYDIIYRNVKLNTDFHCILDVAVQYREDYRKDQDEISFTPIVAEVGDIGKKKGWKEIDCTGKFFKCETKFPKLEAEVNFEII